jgi:hypothetical protein
MHRGISTQPMRFGNGRFGAVATHAQCQSQLRIGFGQRARGQHEATDDE